MHSLIHILDFKITTMLRAKANMSKEKLIKDLKILQIK